MERYKEEFIDFMVDSGALQFGDFVTKSGRQTPFFINTGCFRTGSQLNRLGKMYARTIRDTYGTDFDVLFGPAYKGIPLSVATAMALHSEYGAEVRYCSNRKEIKDHGDRGILLGGPITDGDRIVIIEDVTTAGTSIAETLPILRAQGAAEILGLVVSVDRMERGKGSQSALTEIRETYGIRTCSIVTMAEVVEYLTRSDRQGRDILSEKTREAIDRYYEKYGVGGWPG